MLTVLQPFTVNRLSLFVLITDMNSHQHFLISSAIFVRTDVLVSHVLGVLLKGRCHSSVQNKKYTSEIFLVTYLYPASLSHQMTQYSDHWLRCGH